MISSVSLFTSVTSVVSITVQLPNGAIALVNHIGTVRISRSLTLTDVLCVPSFNFNLISVSKLIKQFCCCLIFLYHHCLPWIIDTGAIDHMISSVSLFTSVTSVVSTTVQFPNGAIALVTHIGIVRISGSLTLTDVLCVSSFNFNLISVSKLIKQFCCCLIFLYHHCFIQNLSPWKTIGVDKEHNGLYFLMLQSHYSSLDLLNSIPQVSQVQSTSVKASSLPADLWHYRLGHPSSSRINLLHNLVPSIPCDSNNT
jgi:uncharacterized membrane protein (DUF2068 family)